MSTGNSGPEHGATPSTVLHGHLLWGCSQQKTGN
jgi:hypothetical protein